MMAYGMQSRTTPSTTPPQKLAPLKGMDDAACPFETEPDSAMDIDSHPAGPIYYRYLDRDDAGNVFERYRITRTIGPDGVNRFTTPTMHG